LQKKFKECPKCLITLFCYEKGLFLRQDLVDGMDAQFCLWLFWSLQNLQKMTKNAKEAMYT
jgi:hypothetical protein